MDKFYKVLTTQGISDYYHYKSDFDITTGALVKIPFAGKEIDGIVVGFSDSIDFPASKLKEISEIYEGLVLDSKLIKFIYWIADYTLSNPPLILKMVLSAQLTTKTHKEIKPLNPNHIDIKLNQEQKSAATALKSSQNYEVFLLNGVTGSGKTEVYFESIVDKVKNGGQVLILMPEIALGTSFVKRFTDRFGVNPLEWHSDLGKKEKREVWHSIKNGEGQVVIGARSALFLPFKNLKMIIVDEEHDTSYKQEDGVVYQARDMAVLRASIEKIPIVLASATPSLETIINVNLGKYKELLLTKRYNDAVMPKIDVINLKESKPEKIGKGQGFLSPKLLSEIKSNLENKEQSLLFLNRKGYAPFVVCGACGHRYQCPNCSSWLVEHRKIGKMRCHQCDYMQTIDGVCVKCNETKSLISCGPGIERIEAEILHYFPDAKVKTLSSENISRKTALQHMEEIVKSETDIIIGTQILAKGYHFPNLTLVGVIDADMGLAGGDLRAMEKTYQLLHQVAGRAGREKKSGRVFLQTYEPEHLLMQAMVKDNADDFYMIEEKMRKQYKMPPFAQLASIVISGIKPEIAQKSAKEIANAFSETDNIAVLGPAPAIIFKISNRHRYRLLLKASKKIKLADEIKKTLANVKIPSSIRIKIDINPYNFL